MPLCVLAGTKTVAMAAAVFSLSWTHSVEETQWEERWTVEPAGLRLVEARVQGSGAGMDPPEGAVFREGWWIWRPQTAPVAELVLAASGATGDGWKLCAGERCLLVGAEAGLPVRLRACDGDH